jgi:photosynthetic reaction center cytochrome c subunit
MRMLIVATAALLLLPVSAQEKQPAQKFEMPDPTNLKVLKVATGSEVVPIMRTFAGGLGVECSYCHVEGNFASDENPKKETARQMIRLVQKINTDFPDGKMRVSCYTCHRGETVPKTAAEPKPGQ